MPKTDFIDLIKGLNALNIREISDNNHLRHLFGIIVEAIHGNHSYQYSVKSEDHISENDKDFFEKKGFTVREEIEHVDTGDGYEANWVHRYTTYIDW